MTSSRSCSVSDSGSGAKVHWSAALAVRREQLQGRQGRLADNRHVFGWVEARELCVLKQGVIAPPEKLTEDDLWLPPVIVSAASPCCAFPSRSAARACRSANR